MKKDLISDITNDLATFCNGFDEIRILGRGLYGSTVYNHMKQENISVSGFVVSDEHYSKNEADTIPISKLADCIRLGTNVGIIVALSDKYYLEIFDNLIRFQIETKRCFLISERDKSILRNNEIMNSEHGLSRSINMYEDFFANVYRCNVPGKLNLICHQHLGDTCILVGLCSEIEHYYGKSVNYIIKDSQKCIPQLFGVEHFKTVAFDDLFDNKETRGFSELQLEFYRSEMQERMFSILPQTYVPFVTAPFYWNTRWEPEWKTVVNSRARMLGMDTTMINPPSGSLEPSEQLMEFVEKEGGWDRVVLVAPEARANPQIPLVYWKNIVSKLKKEGFTVICNAMRKENRLEGTVDLNLSVSDLIALGQRCHEIHSTRSGLCDCLASRGSSLHVYYTNDLDREFEYYSLNNNFYLDDPVTEVMVND